MVQRVHNFNTCIFIGLCNNQSGIGVQGAVAGHRTGYHVQPHVQDCHTGVQGQLLQGEVFTEPVHQIHDCHHKQLRQIRGEFRTMLKLGTSTSDPMLRC